MRKIVIENIGPVNEVNFDLNKVNVLMGPQSSGKSTIAKIISYCQWTEKRYLLDGEYKYDVSEQLLNFHRLSKNYFSKNSFFSYESDFLKISYTGKELKQKIIAKDTKETYKKSKNIYIPSERNFVSVIPNLSKYKETNDNIMNFVYDWFTAKRVFNKDNSLSILNLDIQYFNTTEGDINALRLNNKKEILLDEGSSGLQSVIPLIVLFEYLTDYIFRSTSISVNERDRMYDIFRERMDNLFKSSKELGDLETLKSMDFNHLFKKFTEEYGYFYYFTNFIIEEPEQNLFPSTQRELVNYLLKKMNDERPHSLTITTHSPYILYAINNCLMGYNIKDKIENTDDLEDITNQDSWINPDLVSIWQVHEGKLISVKNEKTKTVTKHYFNEITKDIMDEYYEMLSYFEYD